MIEELCRMFPVVVVEEAVFEHLVGEEANGM